MSPAAAARILAHGGVVAIPTETVYGLAGNAFDPKALARIFAAKGRPTFDPLIVHVADFADLPRVVAHWPASARKLAEAFWPGPLTLVLPKHTDIPDLATSGLSTVGVRMPAHPVAREIIRLAGVPLAAPSANLFQKISPTTAQHVSDQLGGLIDGIVDGGACAIGLESTIVGFRGEQPILYRPGAITPEMLMAVVGAVERHVPTSHPGEPETAQPAPGLLERHYSPATPLLLGNWPAELPERAGLLAFGTLPDCASRCASVFQLSETGDPVEAAARLYAGLRSLDAQGLDVILASPLPEAGLGIAVNDRLRRAASR
jgi:L-threonylcarbamoyladenylate synthase